jgi:predicted amidohydrolase YtcJ
VSADLVVTGGRVVTCDDAGTIAETAAVRGDRILAVGAEADVRALAGPRTRVIDAAGGSVLPGIVDSHIHLAWWGLASPPFTLDLRGAGDAAALVAAATAAAPDGTWIRGRGWREDELPVPSHAAQLDAVAPAHPVVLEHWSYHALLVNTAALRAAGITRATPDPDGGRIERDAGGEPTGVLLEAAADLIRRVVPAWSPAERRAAIAAAARRLVARGVTAVTDPCVTPELLRDYLALRRAGELPLRVVVLLHWDWPSVSSSVARTRAALAHAPAATGLGDEWLRIGGAKLFADGVPALGTAWMSEPYPGGGSGGLVTEGASDAERLEELRGLVALLHGHRFQVQVHATGDRACAAVADALCAAYDADPWDARHVVIHANLLSARDAGRLAERGLAANVNALIKWQAADAVRPLLGEERWHRTMPARTLLGAGVRLADSSDAPIVDPDWRQAVETLVRRRARGSGALSGPDERVERIDALRAWTANAAYQQHADAERGMLTAGRLADLVVLREDVLAIEEDALHAITPVVTVVGGTAIQV